MIIKINDERRYEQSTLYTSYLEENNTTTLEFEFPEYLEKYNKKANFELKDGTKVCKLFNEITSNKLTLTRDLLKFNKLQMAIEFFDTDENLIYRTSILTIIISDSIICDDDVSEDEPKVVILNELIQKVTELDTQVTENEGTRAENETKRETSENVRISNENTRISNENKRIEEENKRISAESTRVSNEEKRVESENLRITQEETRQSNEASRISNEETRTSNENTRIANENKRVEEENKRVLEENTRVSNEEQRVESENLRASQEETRQSNEASRISNEETRTSNENTRIANENKRVEEENKRVLEENTRVSNEEQRVESENLRASQEETRQQNETQRIANEEIRQENAEAILKILPKTETEVQENIDIDDAGESSFNKLSVYGNSRQESTEGYNLLNNTLQSQIINGVTVTVNKDRSITLNGTSTAAITLNYTNDFGIVNGDYIFYLIGKNNKINLQGIENEETIAYLAFSNNNNKIKKKYEVSTTITRIFSYISANTTFNNETFYPMITKGTEEKPYEPYTGGNPSPNPDYPQKIESIKDSINFKRIGKNYFNSEIEMGGYTAAGIKYASNTRVRSVNSFILKPGTYTISCPTATAIAINSAYGNKEQAIYDNNVLTITLEEKQECILTVETPDLLNAKIQIEKGTEATEYEPYHEDVYTLPVQQNMYALVEGQEDCFVKKDDGKWYERHYSFEGELTGEENFFIDNNRYVLYNINTRGFSYAVYNKNTKQLCNYFQFENNWGNKGFFVSGASIRFKKIFETVEEFKQFLKNNTVKVVYIRSSVRSEGNGSFTYLDLECTAEQTTVLNKLEQFSLSKGVNHIYSDDELSPKFKLKYYQDVNILLDKINKNIADVSAQLIEGGSNV